MTPELQGAVEPNAQEAASVLRHLAWRLDQGETISQTRHSFPLTDRLRQIADILSALRAPVEAVGLPGEEVDTVARLIYEADPFYEPGETLEGFQVSPGGYLTWQQAQARDDEFGGNPIFKPILEPSYKLARAVISRLGGRGGESEGWRPIESAPKTGFFLGWRPDIPDLIECWSADVYWHAMAPDCPATYRYMEANRTTLWHRAAQPPLSLAGREERA